MVVVVSSSSTGPNLPILLLLRLEVVVAGVVLRAFFSYLEVFRPVIWVVVVVSSSSTGPNLPILLLLRLEVPVAVEVIALGRGFGSIWPLFGHFRPHFRPAIYKNNLKIGLIYVS